MCGRDSITTNPEAMRRLFKFKNAMTYPVGIRDRLPAYDFSGRDLTRNATTWPKQIKLPLGQTTKNGRKSHDISASDFWWTSRALHFHSCARFGKPGQCAESSGLFSSSAC